MMLHNPSPLNQFQEDAQPLPPQPNYLTEQEHRAQPTEHMKHEGQLRREQVKQQYIPVKVYRTDERLMVAAPMAGLEPEDMVVEVTADGHMMLHGDLRGRLKEVKELVLDEWSVGAYHRELALPVPVNAPCANVTYGNGVLLVALPISHQTLPARLVLKRITSTHGERQGHSGHPTAWVQPGGHERFPAIDSEEREVEP